MKFVELKLEMKDKKTGKKEVIKCFIREGMMTTRYSNHDMATASYMACKPNNGKDGYEVAFKRGIVCEWFKGKTLQELRDLAVEKMEFAKSEAKKKLKSNIKYVLKEKVIEK